MPKIGRQISKRAIGVVLILVSMLVVLGYSTIGNPQSATALAPLQPAATLPSSLSVNLRHAPSGTAQLEWDAKQKSLTVTMNMTSLAPKSTHSVNINKGSCAVASDNGNVTSLTPLAPSTDQAGGPPPPGGGGKMNPLAGPGVGGFGRRGDMWVSKTVLTAAAVPALTSGIPNNQWSIEIHSGQNIAVPAEETVIACGDIVNFDTSTKTNQFVETLLGPSQDDNQAVNGIATFAVANGQLTVTITMSGLKADSKHIAHIHKGSCRSQGDVAYPLNPVVADKAGTGTSTTIIKGVSSIASGWYVNVHQAATAADLQASQVGFDPIACGDVVSSQEG
jgi:hypothetical protein